ncbi:copper chaperone PCu(A)C [Brackiella oedipodis]|uniref:copper chaperone PCu(A)C n=1 Tax=Brackiella oedipodis TaxID=124225 RepID=UPI000686A1BC|nr:copper chaperone PCu(A)C [Brackiella oedipodis]
MKFTMTQASAAALAAFSLAFASQVQAHDHVAHEHHHQAEATSAHAEHDHAEHMHHHMHDMHANAEAANKFTGTEKPASHVAVDQCWVRLMPKDIPSAGFFELHNQDTKDRALIAAQIDGFATSMMHQTVSENNTASMKMVEKAVVKPKQTLSFKPGSYHLMLFKPQATLKAGQHVKAKFKFADDTVLTSECKINSNRALKY